MVVGWGMPSLGVERSFQRASLSAYSLLVKYDRYGVNTEYVTVNTKPTQPMWATHDPKRLCSRSRDVVCVRG